MKKLLLFFALVAISLSYVRAYDFSAVAPSGQTLYYNISGTTATITYPYYSSYWNGYSQPTENLVIPESVTYAGTTYRVTSIGSDAFSNCSGQTSVTIGSSVTLFLIALFSALSVCAYSIKSILLEDFIVGFCLTTWSNNNIIK